MMSLQSPPEQLSGNNGDRAGLNLTPTKRSCLYKSTSRASPKQVVSSVNSPSDLYTSADRSVENVRMPVEKPVFPVENLPKRQGSKIVGGSSVKIPLSTFSLQ